MSESMDVTKHGQHVPVSSALRSNPADNAYLITLPAIAERMLNATAEQRAEWARERERREAEAARERAEVRAATGVVLVTTEGLSAKLGWPRGYAEHLVQPYCECGADIDGWTYCRHAYDLGLAP